MAKYEVDVTIEVEIDNDDLDGEDEAFKAVDETLQRLWDRDHAGSKPGTPRHFTMFEGSVARVVEEDV
jgi:hypothetical protein